MLPVARTKYFEKSPPDRLAATSGSDFVVLPTPRLRNLTASVPLEYTGVYHRRALAVFGRKAA